MTQFFAILWGLAQRPLKCCWAVLLLAVGLLHPAVAEDDPTLVIAEDSAAIAQLPIILKHNRIHVEMTVHGTPMMLLLDTGASSTILFGSGGLDASRLPAGENLDINFPAFRTSASGRRLPPTRFEAGDLTFVSDRTIFIESRDKITGSSNEIFHGILGRDFFEAFIIEIVPSEEVMLIYENGTKVGSRFRMRHQLYMDGGSPYLMHRSRLPWENRRTPKKLLLDTGYPGGIVLWDEGHFTQATSLDERETLRAENKGIIYYGTVRFGRLIFKNIPIFLGPTAPERTDGRHGIIGASMFLPFRYAFDFQRKSLWLMPRVKSYGIGFQIRNDVIYTPGDEDFIMKEFRPKPEMQPKITLHREDTTIPE